MCSVELLNCLIVESFSEGYSFNSNFKKYAPLQGAQYFGIIINPERCSGLTKLALSGRG
jgi:hypothetical protein